MQIAEIKILKIYHIQVLNFPGVCQFFETFYRYNFNHLIKQIFDLNNYILCIIFYIYFAWVRVSIKKKKFHPIRINKNNQFCHTLVNSSYNTNVYLGLVTYFFLYQ